MDALEIKSIVEQALRDPRNFPFLVYALIFVVAAAGAYFGAFLRRKGQNLADKQDIEKLTQIVEEVRTKYAKDLENLAQENRKFIELMSQEHQLRLAALDRRLEAHQEAFSTWWGLATTYHDQHQRQQNVLRCQAFWNSNCLYLGKRTRKVFRETMIDVMFYEAAKDEGFAGMKDLSQKIEAVFLAIFDERSPQSALVEVQLAGMP